VTEIESAEGPQEEAQKAGNQMSKIRTTLASALAIASLLAGGMAAGHISAPRPAHHLADGGCCEDEGAST
jgi:hypothetical protein